MTDPRRYDPAAMISDEDLEEYINGGRAAMGAGASIPQPSYGQPQAPQPAAAAGIDPAELADYLAQISEAWGEGPVVPQPDFTRAPLPSAPPPRPRRR